MVWKLEGATIPFPTGCSGQSLDPTIMGMDAYKIAIGIMLVARASGRTGRFYAHAPRGSGCGVDYLQLN